MSAKKHANPMLTKTGKQRLGPLNFKQLNDLVAKENRPKVKAKIQRRIWKLVHRSGHNPDVVANTSEQSV